ncbi:MAG: alpha/beta fold hydrolase [Halioglobus sp.]
MTAELFVRRAGEGPAVVLLHGLFGSGGNLGALSRALQTEFSVYSVDLPGHGRSGWLLDPDLPAMADSVYRWMDGEGLARAHLVGHSLGGKVAMQFALQHGARADSLVVADIAPVSYMRHHDAVFTALAAVAAQQCRSRDEAAALLARHLREPGVAQFLLSSLQRDDNGVYRWRFDLSGLESGYAALLAAPEAEHAYAGPVLFIKGGTSDYIQEQHWPAVQARFPNAAIKVMPDCGHWLHAEKPQQFNGIVRRFLEAQEQRKLALQRAGRES